MGGKQKQGNRTKGNTRPSSSARAAEFLQNTTLSDGATGGFVGFSSLSGDLGFVPASQGSEEADGSVDAEFRFVLRKLSKRDATTKLKALQELTALCKEKESELVKTVLPFWPRIYSKISMDQDRRVREALQQAHHQLCLKVRRDLAPHLRQLIGAWMLAQCDPYAPASSAAKAAFQTAFTPLKQTEAIAYCKEQIFNMMCENILTHTPQTLSDPKCTEPEDLESKYLRVLASSLSALILLLLSITEKHSDFVEQHYAKLLSSNKFWKYAKHSSPPVTSAFFSLISAVCQNAPTLSDKFADKICPTVLHNLDRTDPVVVPPLWECALQTVTAIPNCWEKVNARKGVLPKLWQVMRNGGSGSAALICPNWLPLLSLIPPDVKGEGIAFYKEFFGNMKKGLSADGVQRSPRELNAIIVAFVECLRFTASSQNEDLVNYLSNELFSVVEMSIEEAKPALAQSVLYVEFSALLLGFNKTKATHILGIFCDHVSRLSMKCISDNETSLTRLLSLFNSFHGNKPTKKSSVKFDVAEIIKPTKENSLFDEELLVREIVCKSIAASYQTDSMLHLKFFCASLATFMGSHLLGYLVDSKHPAEEVVRSKLLPLALDDAHSNMMPSIISAAIACFTESKQKTEFLDMLIEHANQGLFANMMLQKIIETSRDRSVTAWFRGQSFGLRMIEVTKKLCSEENAGDEQSWMLLRLALSSDSLLSEEFLSRIISTIRDSLPSIAEMSSAKPCSVQKCVSFVCKVAVILFSYDQGCVVRDSSTELLMALFMIDCSKPTSLNAECIDEVRNTWKQGVRSLVKQQGGFVSEEDGNFFHCCLTSIKSTLLNDVFSTNRLEDVIQITVELMSCLSDEEIVCLMLEKLRMPLMEELVPKQWSLDVMFSGEITLQHQPTCKNSTQYNILPQCITPVAFYSDLLLRTECSIESIVLIELGGECCYSIALLKSLLALNSEAHHSSEMKKVLLQLERNFMKLSDSSTEENKLKLLSHLLDKSLEATSPLWCLALATCLKVYKSFSNLDLKATFGSLDRYAASCNTLQVIVDSLTHSQVMEIADTRTAILLSLPPDALASHHGGIGHIGVFRHCLHANEPDPFSMPFGSECRVDLSIVKTMLTLIQSWRQNHEQIFLFDSDMQTFDWNFIAFNRDLAHLLADFVVLLPKELSSDHWDFILCTLMSWIQSCHESQSALTSDPKCQAFASAVFHLLSRVALCMHSILPASEADFPSTLLSEWTEFFSEGAYSLILPMFIHITGDSSAQSSLLLALCSAISLCPSIHLEKHQLPAKLSIDDDSGLPDDLLTLINHFCPLLLSQHRCVQIAAFRVLMSVTPCLSAAMNAENDQTRDENSAEQEKEAKCPPLALMSTLDLSSQAVEGILHDHTMGETIIIEAFIPEHSLTFAYLLTWRLLLALVQQAPSQLRAEYAEHLKSSLAVDVLMLNLFRLMPQSPLLDLKESLTSHSQSEALSTKTSLFGPPPLLDIFSMPSSIEVQHLACSVYAQCLKDLPAVLRQWWNGHDRHNAMIVEEYTMKYVSPILIQEEIASVQTAAEQHSDENLKVKGRPVAREVVATFQMEEVTMELIVQLPQNFPLGVMQVETARRVGVATAQWRNWMLQLTTFLMHQNGSIMDGLALWKQNVDKRFEGIEDCMICFSVIHGTTAQVPKLKCRTCKKKYHSACLYKWFNSSTGTTCPLCRNLF